MGSLINADPSSRVFAESIHLGFQDPPSETVREFGAPHGIRTVTARELRYNDPQWNKKHPKESD